MVKKIIYLTITILLFFTAIGLVAIAPYHIYTLTLTEGVNTRFLTMSPTRAAYYDGEEIKLEAPKDMSDESLYENFHFGHFELPMPINHPLFFMIPIIKIEGVGPRLGASFQNGKNVELFNFMLERPYKFVTTSGDQKLFTLPIFKNYISRKSNDEVWGDLFKKRLSLPSNDGKSFFESLVTLRKVTYNDLVYNLYILYNRRFLVPDNTTKISFYADKNIGIVELPSSDDNILVERIFIIEKGLIYPLLIKTKKNTTSAMNFRNKFLRSIIYKNTSSDSAISIYAHYKQIPYNQRIDQQGMTYLYSAWSHDLDNRDFVRVIILFLERGKLNLKYLKPFYEFAYKKFGSTLSSDSGYLNETVTESLKRKISDELENEVKKEANQPVMKTDGQFASPDDKINYNLQRAKDKKINSDDSKSELSIE